jgi:hypothetical protein
MPAYGIGRVDARPRGRPPRPAAGDDIPRVEFSIGCSCQDGSHGLGGIVGMFTKVEGYGIQVRVEKWSVGMMVRS